MLIKQSVFIQMIEKDASIHFKTRAFTFFFYSIWSGYLGIIRSDHDAKKNMEWFQRFWTIECEMKRKQFNLLENVLHRLRLLSLSMSDWTNKTDATLLKSEF